MATRAGATAVETGPQESALLLGAAFLASEGVPQEEILTLIDESRTELYSTRMRDIFGEEKPGKKRAKEEKRASEPKDAEAPP
jgi:hypothetical protein